MEVNRSKTAKRRGIVMVFVFVVRIVVSEVRSRVRGESVVRTRNAGRQGDDELQVVGGEHYKPYA